MIGQPERGHAELGGACGHPAVDLVGLLVDDLARPVEQRVLAVDVKVDDFDPRLTRDPGKPARGHPRGGRATR